MERTNEHSSQWKPRVDWQGFPAAGNLRDSSRANSEGQLLLLPWGVSHRPGKSDASSCSHLCLRVQATLVLNARRKEKEAGVNLFCHDYSFCLSIALSPNSQLSPSPSAERPTHWAVGAVGGTPMVKDQILTSCPSSASHLLVTLLGKLLTLLDLRNSM